MSDSSVSSEIAVPVFDPPGPGQWNLDRSHYPGGTTPISEALMHGCETGCRRAFAEMGMPADTLVVAFVNGFMYSRLRPLVRPDKPPRRPPPAFVLRIGSRLHPLMRARARSAKAALEARPWRAVIADWHATTKPRIEARNLALQTVEPSSLDDAALAAHLGELYAWCVETFDLHFYLHSFDLGPIGMLLAGASGWGLPVDEVVAALEGASPSTSEPARLLSELRDEVHRSGCEPTTLDEVRAVSERAADLLHGYLRRRGAMMVTRYDLDGQTLAERPATILSTILSEPAAGADPARADAVAAALRLRVPAGERDEFDERLAEARDAMDLRDDNGPYTAEWPIGLLRRGLLALGLRLAARGRIEHPEHTFELKPGEVVPLATNGSGPSAAELAERARDRQRRAALDPPGSLGAPEPEPPPSVLAAPHQVMVGAVKAVIEHLGMGPAQNRAPLAGTGVGSTSYRGRARLASNPEAALDVLEPGDVLVVSFTTPAYNTVLSLAGAVVTTEGGPLCHAAVMARELGIPAVIGARGALDLVPDGTEVEVDPVAGEVRLVAGVAGDA